MVEISYKYKVPFPQSISDRQRAASHTISSSTAIKEKVGGGNRLLFIAFCTARPILPADDTASAGSIGHTGPTLLVGVCISSTNKTAY